MTPQAKLNGVLIEWDKAAEAFGAAVAEGAQCDVDYERYAARERIKLKAAAAETGEKLTVPDLNAMIVNNDVDNLLQKRELSAAVVTGLRKRLDVFQAKADAARSEIASERKREEAWGASPSVPGPMDVPERYRGD